MAARVERRMIEVEGATIEVFLTGTESPAVCQSHTFVGTLPEPMPDGQFPWPWDGSIRGLVSVNPRGVGNSSARNGPSDFTLRQHLDDLEAVRQQLGVARWVFWGSSGGGVLAQAYALALPQALSGLIIMSAGPSGPRVGADTTSRLSPHNPQYRDEMARLAADPLRERRQAILASVEPRFRDAAWVRLREGVWVFFYAGQPLAVTGENERVWASMEEAFTFEVWDRLHEIVLPTLVVAGRLDDAIPIAHSALVHTGIAQSEFVVLEESGHAYPDPESADGVKLRLAIERFLGRLQEA